MADDTTEIEGVRILGAQEAQKLAELLYPSELLARPKGQLPHQVLNKPPMLSFPTGAKLLRVKFKP